MNFSEFLSSEQAEANYPLLRLEAAKILTPKPWEHHPATSVEEGWGIKEWDFCDKCNGPLVGDCPVIDPLTEPMPVIAEMLLRKVLKTENGDIALGLALPKVAVGLHKWWCECDNIHVWWKLSSAEHATCCLAALEGETK